MNRTNPTDSHTREPTRSGTRPDVLLADDVGPATVRIGAYRLAVRHHDDAQQRRDRDRDREDIGLPARARCEQDDHDLLRGVGDGGHRVGAEDRQGQDLREQSVFQPAARHRPPDEDSLEDRAPGAGLGGHTGRDATTRTPPGEGVPRATTGDAEPIHRYPTPGSVRISRGAEASSPSLRRIARTYTRR